MSRVFGPGKFMRKPAVELQSRLRTLARCALLGSLLYSVDSHTDTVLAQQEAPTGAKTQVAYLTRNIAMDKGPATDLSTLDIPSLVRDSDRLGTAMHLQLPEYTYVQTRLSRELDRGRMLERVSSYEAYPIIALGRTRHIISLISENGAPISQKRLKKERQQAAKEIETAERENAFNTRSAPPSLSRYVSAGIGVSQTGDGVWIGVSQFLQRCSFGTPRYERLRDRDMIALDIDSCSGTASDPREFYLEKMAGIVWIDAADRVVARLEAWPRVSSSENTETSSHPTSSHPTSSHPTSSHPGAETLVYEQMRLPNGLWVPRRIRLNAIGKAELFNGTDKDMTFEFSSYQRFFIEVEELQQTQVKSK